MTRSAAALSAPPRPAWLQLQRAGARLAGFDVSPQLLQFCPDVLYLHDDMWWYGQAELGLLEFKDLKLPAVLNNQFAYGPRLLINKVSEFGVVVDDLIQVGF